MGKVTGIEWCHHTMNPWRGCTKVSPGCKNCYAETLSHRNPLTLGVWGNEGTRVVAAESTWREPLKWDREAKAVGERRRVFCASLADVFEDWRGPMVNSKGTPYWAGPGQTQDATMDDLRRRLFTLIDATPHLDWLILTKRPENVLRMWPPLANSKVLGAYTATEVLTRPNVWLGTSPCNQETADKLIPELLKTPAAVRFLSCEPLLGPVSLSKWLTPGFACDDFKPGVHWAIVGGESGPGARPCRVEWVRSIVEQCQAASVPCFVKQFGGNIVTRNDMIEDAFNNGESGWPDPDVEHNIHGFREDYQGADCRIRLKDRKGGDIEEFPDDLRVRQFPA